MSRRQGGVQVHERHDFIYRSTVAVALGIVLAGAARPALAAPEPALACVQKKQKAAGKSASTALKCVSAGVLRGVPADPACLGRASDRLVRTFSKVDGAGGCAVTGDAGVVGTAIDACVGSIRTVLGVPAAGARPASRCTALKANASGKAIGAQLKCWGKALRTGGAASALCLGKAEVKLTDAFGKAETRGFCLETGDATAARAAVATCVSDVLAAVPAPTATTTTISTTTTTTGVPCASDPEPAGFAGVTAAHNDVRATASPAPSPALQPLCWDSSLAAIAQGTAAQCAWAHSGAPGLGENLYAVTGNQVATGSVDAVAEWAAEAPDYHYATNTCSGVCGHYTQIVWRSTVTTGCGMTVCTTGSPFGPSFPTWTFVVCNYAPQGNIVGQRPY